jgi:hypothetical protein
MKAFIFKIKALFLKMQALFLKMVTFYAELWGRVQQVPGVHIKPIWPPFRPKSYFSLIQAAE